MKSMTKIGIGAAMIVLLAAVAVQPAEAACPANESRLINLSSAYLVSNPAWCNDGSAGCYLADSGGPPVSANLDGIFWGWTGGDAAYATGADNGTWNVDSWVLRGYVSATYAYPTVLAQQDGNNPDWATTPAIDGCVADITPETRFDECTCILLTDEWDGQGYFAILSNVSDGQGNFNFFTAPGGIVQLAPIPRPEITGSSRDGATGDVTFNINVPTPVGGDYRDQACDCNFGFRVFSQVLGRGAMMPASRTACTQRALRDATDQNIPADDPGFADACLAAGFNWVPADGPGGGPQGITPFNGTRATSSVTVSCGNTTDHDLYLATAISANEGVGGFTLGAVGQNSFMVECGAQYVDIGEDPERPGRSGDAPRGRDNNRGRAPRDR